MKAKYIFFFCTAMNFFVSQSVATKSSELPLAGVDFFEAVTEAYNTTREFYQIPLGGKLTVEQFMWLIDTNDFNMIYDNFNEDRIEAMYNDNISEAELFHLIRTICTRTDQEVLGFMTITNRKLKDKAVHEAYNTTREFFQIPLGGKLTLKQFMWLMDTDDINEILDNLDEAKTAAIFSGDISEDTLLNIIRTICNKTGQELLNFMKTINKQLKDKLAAINACSD